MNKKLAGVITISMLALPSAWAGSGGGDHGNGSGGGAAVSSSSSASANGGAGGAGGSATGGAATGGSATGGSASGNTSNVTVSLTTGGATTADGTAGEVGSSAYNTKATVDYGGSYTVKSTPPVAAPALTSTFSDTCMGSSSFGLSMVGFGATGGTTMVDEACVRRLDSREFRAMGLNDVALALLCQSDANRKAVEATGRSCPGATPALVSVASVSKAQEQPTDPIVRRRLGLQSVGAAAATPAATTSAATAVAATAPVTEAETLPAVTPVTPAAVPAVTPAAEPVAEPLAAAAPELAAGTGEVTVASVMHNELQSNPIRDVVTDGK